MRTRTSSSLTLRTITSSRRCNLNEAGLEDRLLPFSRACKDNSIDRTKVRREVRMHNPFKWLLKCNKCNPCSRCIKFQCLLPVYTYPNHNTYMWLITSIYLAKPINMGTRRCNNSTSTNSSTIQAPSNTSKGRVRRTQEPPALLPLNKCFLRPHKHPPTLLPPLLDP
jgi:hypothetical protein